jgi:tRNA (guanosine-2'-O-)-methyltransferase
MDELKRLDYRFLGATLSDRAKPMHEINFQGKIAIVLGNEEAGCSSEVLSRCHEEFYIPSVGMTKSFNVSVAASIIAHHVFLKRLEQGQHRGDLSDEHRLSARALAYMQSGDYRTTEAMLEHMGYIRPRRANMSDSTGE